MKVLFTDHGFPDIEIERSLFAAAGIELKVAQCKSVDDVIRESNGCHALLITYAPADAQVFTARPEIGIVSRIGAGFDMSIRAMRRSTVCGWPIHPTMVRRRWHCMR